MATTIYKEKQKFENKVVLAMLGLSTAIIFFGACKSLFQSEENWGNAVFLLLAVLLFGGLTWWLTKVRLRVSITDKKIKCKTLFLQPKKLAITWDEVKKCDIVKTPAAAAWCGYGITFNHEKRISLSGRNGLAITTKDGDQYFIGCQKMAELEEAFAELDLIQHPGD